MRQELIYCSSGPCITNVIATCRKNFSQWESSFLWKLRCHWLKFLRRVAKTLVIQGPALSRRVIFSLDSTVFETIILYRCSTPNYQDELPYRCDIGGRTNSVDSEPTATCISYWQRHLGIQTSWYPAPTYICRMFPSKYRSVFVALSGRCLSQQGWLSL